MDQFHDQTSVESPRHALQHVCVCTAALASGFAGYAYEATDQKATLARDKQINTGVRQYTGMDGAHTKWLAHAFATLCTTHRVLFCGALGLWFLTNTTANTFHHRLGLPAV